MDYRGYCHHHGIRFGMISGSVHEITCLSSYPRGSDPMELFQNKHKSSTSHCGHWNILWKGETNPSPGGSFCASSLQLITTPLAAHPAPITTLSVKDLCPCSGFKTSSPLPLIPWPPHPHLYSTQHGHRIQGSVSRDKDSNHEIIARMTAHFLNTEPT